MTARLSGSKITQESSKVIIKQKLSTTGARLRLIKNKNFEVDCQSEGSKGNLIGDTNLEKAVVPSIS